MLVAVFSQHLLTFVVLLRCHINKLFSSPQIVPLSHCLHWIKCRGYHLWEPEAFEGKHMDVRVMTVYVPTRLSAGLLAWLFPHRMRRLDANLELNFIWLPFVVLCDINLAHLLATVRMVYLIINQVHPSFLWAVELFSALLFIYTYLWNLDHLT